MPPPPIAELACDLRAEPRDEARWHRLARALCDHDRLDHALALCDDAATHLDRERARALLLGIGASPSSRAGRAFAPGPRLAPGPRPDHDDGPCDPLRPRRATGAPATWLVPSGEHWSRFAAASDGPLEVLEPTAATDPLCALPDGGVAFARDTALLLRDPGQATPHTLATLPHPITALLGPLAADSGTPAPLALATARDGVRDVYLVDLARHAATPRMLSNISAALAGEAAALPGVGFGCIGDGVQASEVRFVWPDGHWQARLVHRAPLRGIAPVDADAVASIDRDGVIVVWRGDPPRPREAGRVGETFGALVRRAVQLIYRAAAREAVLLHADRGGLVFAPLEDEATSFLAGPSALPADADGADPLVPVGARDGWLWLDLRRRTMPPAWQLSARLATEAELHALPGLGRAPADALLAWREHPASPAPGSAGELALRVRCSAPVLETL